MKKTFFIALLFLTTSVALFAQDYKVESIELIPNDTKATLEQYRERLNSGQICAVLRIVTKNISVAERSTFDFKSDLGSYIPEKRTENSQLLLWVSPGITSLIINSELGELEIYFPDYIEIESKKIVTID